MAGAWQGQYKYLLGFLIVLVSGMAAGLLGKLSGWRHLSTCSVFWPFFCGLGNWLRNYSVFLPFEIPHYTYRRHTLATIDRVSMLSLTTLFCLFYYGGSKKRPRDRVAEAGIRNTHLPP